MSLGRAFFATIIIKNVRFPQRFNNHRRGLKPEPSFPAFPHCRTPVARSGVAVVVAKGRRSLLHQTTIHSADVICLQVSSFGALIELADDWCVKAIGRFKTSPIRLGDIRAILVWAVVNVNSSPNCLVVSLDSCTPEHIFVPLVLKANHRVLPNNK